MTPTCPKCRQAIASEDINVANDVAFCRSCNVAHKFSDLVHERELMMDVDLTRPPAGTWHRGTGMETVVGASHRSWGAALVTLGMTLFWNGIVSVFVALALSSTLHLLGVPVPGWMPNPNMNGDRMGVGITIFLWLFLTPFILIGIAFFLGFLSSIWGRTEARVTQGRSVIFSGIGPWGRKKWFNAPEVKSVRILEEEWRNSKGRHGTKKKIVIERTDGKDIKFGSSLGDEKMGFITAALRHALGL